MTYSLSLMLVFLGDVSLDNLEDGVRDPDSRCLVGEARLLRALDDGGHRLIASILATRAVSPLATEGQELDDVFGDSVDSHS